MSRSGVSGLCHRSGRHEAANGRTHGPHEKTAAAYGELVLPVDCPWHLIFLILIF